MVAFFVDMQYLVQLPDEGKSRVGLSTHVSPFALQQPWDVTLPTFGSVDGTGTPFDCAMAAVTKMAAAKMENDFMVAAGGEDVEADVDVEALLCNERKVRRRK